MKKILLLLTVTVHIALFALPVQNTYAVPDQSGWQAGFGKLQEVAGGGGVLTGQEAGSQSILRSIINWFLGLVGLIALAVLIYGGAMFITSTGNPDKAKQAKMLILYAVVGLLIVGVSALLVNTIISLFSS